MQNLNVDPIGSTFFIMLQDTLEKLVKFKTVSHDYVENELALNWIVGELKGLPLNVKEVKFNDFSSLLITTQDTKEPAVWLAAHSDVVTATNEFFTPVKRGNKLYGRGVYDMKYAIACYIKLLKELGDELKNYNLAVLITTDEEVGGQNGTKAVLEQGYGGKVCILPDGGFNWNFNENAKGIMRLCVKSAGNSSHSSRPWMGKNAIQNLLDFISALRSEFPATPKEVKNHYYSTCEATVINGGSIENQLPDFAEAIVDIRFIPDLTLDEVRDKITKAKENFVGIEIEEKTLTIPFALDRENKYFKSFSKTAKEKFDIETGFSISHGSSDARFFWDRNIFPIVVAPDGGGAHGEEEWIDLEDLERFYEVLKEFVKKEAKV